MFGLNGQIQILSHDSAKMRREREQEVKLEFDSEFCKYIEILAIRFSLYHLYIYYVQEYI